MSIFTQPSPFAFLNQLSEQALAELNSKTTAHRFNQGEVIIHKGQKIGGAYLVQSGTLRVYTMDINGNEKPIYSLNAGEICIFSMDCVLRQVVYPAWVTVDSDSVEVFAIPTATFKHLYENEPTVRDYLLNSLSQRVFDLMSAIEEVSIYDLEHRINSFLVRACPVDHIITMSHNDIAVRLGTAREVVSRHLKLLEKQGYIELSRMKIKILSPETLASITPQ